MATKVVDVDGAVIASFTAADDFAVAASQVKMGPLAGGRAIAQFSAAATDGVFGSNDGVNFSQLVVTSGANSIIPIDNVPLYISVPAANTGTVIVVGWQDR